MDNNEYTKEYRKKNNLKNFGILIDRDLLDEFDKVLDGRSKRHWLEKKIREAIEKGV